MKGLITIMEKAQLRFTAKKGTTAVTSDGHEAVKASFDGTTVTVGLTYRPVSAQEADSFKDRSPVWSRPLTLNAPAVEGDNVIVELLPQRISIFVNGELFDEDFPVGVILDGVAASEGDFDIDISAVDESNTACPKPRKGISFSELRRPGVNIGDCMPFSDTRSDSDGRFHLFWLYDRHHHCSKWGLGAHQWAHASTKDFVSWDEYPMAVPITEQYEGSICTGSTIRNDSGAEHKFTAWYAIRMSDRSPARIKSSVSEDNINYRKTGAYFSLPERYDGPSARDPKAIYAEGKYHLLITTSLKETGEGCLAHIVSDNADMSNFTDLGPILRMSETASEAEKKSGSSSWRDQPECPDWFKMGRYYYIVWSQRGGARYAFSDTPFGESGWTIPEDNRIPVGAVPKSAVCPWNGERVFVGFTGENGYGGGAVAARTVQESDGTLRFVEMAL